LSSFLDEGGEETWDSSLWLGHFAFFVHQPFISFDLLQACTFLISNRLIHFLTSKLEDSYTSSSIPKLKSLWNLSSFWQRSLWSERKKSRTEWDDKRSGQFSHRRIESEVLGSKLTSSNLL